MLQLLRVRRCRCLRGIWPSDHQLHVPDRRQRTPCFLLSVIGGEGSLDVTCDGPQVCQQSTYTTYSGATSLTCTQRNGCSLGRITTGSGPFDFNCGPGDSGFSPCNEMTITQDSGALSETCEFGTYFNFNCNPGQWQCNSTTNFACVDDYPLCPTAYAPPTPPPPPPVSTGPCGAGDDCHYQSAGDYSLGNVCNFDCSGAGSCQSGTILCGSGPCTITCSGDYSCGFSQITGGSGDVTIDCIYVSADAPRLPAFCLMSLEAVDL